MRDPPGSERMGDLKERLSDAERDQAVVWLRDHLLSGGDYGQIFRQLEARQAELAP